MTITADLELVQGQVQSMRNTWEVGQAGVRAAEEREDTGEDDRAHPGGQGPRTK